MSAVFFLVVLCIVLGYILYDTSRKNRRIKQPPSNTVFKKPNSYMLQCEILHSMSKQKSQVNNKCSKFKVSMHFTGKQPPLPSITPLLQKLTPTMDFYLIINTTQPNTPLLSTLQSLLDKRKVFRCSKYEGQLALIRQLSSRIHIQTDINVIKSLKPYLNNIVTTRSVVEEHSQLLKSSVNVYSFQDLGELFASLEKMKV